MTIEDLGGHYYFPKWGSQRFRRGERNLEHLIEVEGGERNQATPDEGDNNQFISSG